MTYRNTVALTAIATLLTAAPAFAGDEAKSDMSQQEVFMEIDTNSDNQLTFTEFANFSESHGMSTSVAAQEFSRLAGQDTTINMDGFADFDMANLKGRNMTASGSVETYENQPEAVLNRTLTASPETSGMMRAEYGEFSRIDADSDGTVNFDEYHKFRKSQGLSSATKAAQEFTKLSNDQVTLTANQYQTAMSKDVLNTPRYELSSGSQAAVSASTAMDSDMRDDKRTADDYPLDNNPAGLNQMNNPDEMSNMTNSGAETDLDKTSNPQMKVWGEE